MSHSYSHNLIHCVFSTKDRRHTIRDPQSLWHYVAATGHAKNIHVVAAGGTANHLHVLVLLHQTMNLSKAMQELKSNSSRWLSETATNFQWQQGYGAFSVSQSQRQAVTNYIANQAEHHRRWTFEDEFVALLKKSGVPYDSRYVFG